MSKHAAPRKTSPPAPASEKTSLRIEYIDLADLVRAPRNPKQHDLGAIHQSISRFGFVSPIILDERTGRLLAGHGRLDSLQAAKASGSSPPERIVAQDGSWRVPVVRGVASRSDQDAEAYLVADNRTTELGGWDDAALASLLSDLAAQDALVGTGFDKDDLDTLLRDLGYQQEPTPDPGAQMDRAEELREKWQTARGQLWQIGNHRLLCGDSTSAEDGARVMGGEKAGLVCTDPPYNVGIEYGSGTNDSKTIEQNEAFIAKWFEQYKAVPVKVVTPGAGYHLGTLRSWLTLFPPRWMCLWLRRNSMSHSPLRGFSDWEPVLFYKNEEKDRETEWGGILVYGKPQTPIGQDIFDIPVRVQPDVADEKGNKYHPVPKPLALFVVLLRKFSKIGQVIVDPFLGSGTTMVAAEQLGRICYGLEIEPKYCAVILERMSGMGLTPRLVDP